MRKKVKSFLSAFLCLALILTLCGSREMTAKAAGGNPNLKMTVSAGEVYVGDTFTVAVAIEESQLYSFTAKLLYDKTQLECIGMVGSVEAAPNNFYVWVDGDPFPLKATAAGYNQDEGVASFVIASGTEVTYATSTLFTATFKVLKAGEIQLALFEDSNGTDGCKNESFGNQTVNATVKPVAATAVKLDKTTLQLGLAERTTLTATLEPDNATSTVTWSSSNKEVATVDENGLVIGIGAGQAVITATVSDTVKATCTVTVACKHDNVTKYPAKAPTCTEKGNDAYTICNDCHTVCEGSNAEKAALGHSYVNHEAVAATCIAEGTEQYYSCENCSQLFDKDKKEINAVPVTQKTDHTPDEDDFDCTTANICSVCKKVLVPAAEAHEAMEDDGDCTTAVYCKHEGCKQIATPANKQHTGGTATCKTLAKCEVCQKEYGELAAHQYKEGDYVVKEGVTDKHFLRCLVCGDYDEGEAHDPDRETADDEHDKICKKCGYVMQIKGHYTHTLELVEKVEPTCTEDGYKEYYHCTKEGCDVKYADKTGIKEIKDAATLVIPKLGHDFADATCTAPKTCKRENCNVTEGEALGHDFTVKNHDANQHWLECSRKCGEKDQVADHVYSTATDASCRDCDYVREVSNPVVITKKELSEYEVPTGLQGKYETADEVKTAILEKVSETKVTVNGESIQFKSENTVIYDYDLKLSDGSALTVGTNYTIYIPYPAGTNSDTYTFKVVHMIDEGTSAGTFEVFTEGNGSLVYTGKGIEIDVTSASPFAVSYAYVAPQVSYGTGGSAKVESSADDTKWVITATPSAGYKVASITLDGVSQTVSNNTFAVLKSAVTTESKIVVNFAKIPVPSNNEGSNAGGSGNSGSGTTETTTTTTTNNNDTKLDVSPKTDDIDNSFVWLIVALFAGLCGIGVSAYGKKKQK